MSWIAELRDFPKRLAACERGSVMTVMAICSIVLVGAVGTAIDVGRLQVAQSKLQTALDSAGLAAGSMLSVRPGTLRVARIG
jgi:Flp pilus assembly protein TadG